MTAGIGHNSETVLQKDAQNVLRAFLEQAESIIDNELHDAKLALKEKMSEIRSAGFDTKAVRKLIAMRAKDKTKVQEENAILALYAHAVGCDDLV